MPPKKAAAAAKGKNANTVEVVLTLEGVPGNEVVAMSKEMLLPQILASWIEKRGLDPAPWRLLLQGRKKKVISTFSSSTKKLKEYSEPFTATVSFRGVALPSAILPVRLAACDPAVRARPEAVTEVFENMLDELILPLALREPLDISRAALVAKPWGTGVRDWFAADRWVKIFGLSQYFTTHDQAAAALDVLKAIERPSPELAATLMPYQAEVKSSFGMNVTTYEGFEMRVGKLAGIPYTFLWRECNWALDSCWINNLMLTVGTFSGGRLHYDEIFSYTAGEADDDPCLNLHAFLPLRGRLHECFPSVAAAGLSDMQLLILLTHTTFPWPVDLDDSGIYGGYSFSGPLLKTLAEALKHMESMRRRPAKHWLQGEQPPGGMDFDYSLSCYNYVDSLSVVMTLTKKFRADLKAKLGLVTEFHLGQRR